MILPAQKIFTSWLWFYLPKKYLPGGYDFTCPKNIYQLVMILPAQKIFTSWLWFYLPKKYLPVGYDFTCFKLQNEEQGIFNWGGGV